MYKCFLFTLEAFEFRFRGMTNMIYFYAFIHSFIRVYIIHKYISLVIVNITCDAMFKPYTRYLFIHLSGCLSTRVYLCAWCEMCKSCKLIGFKRKWRTRNCGEKKREKVYAILIVYSSSAVLHTHISIKIEIRVECVRFYRLQIKYFHHPFTRLNQYAVAQCNITESSVWMCKSAKACVCGDDDGFSLFSFSSY